MALAAASVLSLLGCGPLSGASSGRKEVLEQQIRTQLPNQLERTLRTAVTVSQVGCAELTETTFDCLAVVQASDLRGRPIRQNLPIDGSCDDEQCLWSVRAP